MTRSEALRSNVSTPMAPTPLSPRSQHTSGLPSRGHAAGLLEGAETRPHRSRQTPISAALVSVRFTLGVARARSLRTGGPRAVDKPPVRYVCCYQTQHRLATGPGVSLGSPVLSDVDCHAPVEGRLEGDHADAGRTWSDWVLGTSRHRPEIRPSFLPSRQGPASAAATRVSFTPATSYADSATYLARRR
jgi:hypothetical protein